LRKIGEDVTETLELIPRQWKVIQHVREKFSCRGDFFTDDTALSKLGLGLGERHRYDTGSFLSLGQPPSNGDLAARRIARHSAHLRRGRYWLSGLAGTFQLKSRDSIGRARMHMTYAIIRGNNGRRHEVDFGDSPVRVEVYASEATVEIFVEADFETLPEERRRFGLVNVPRDQFSHATGEAARRATRKDRYRRATSA